MKVNKSNLLKILIVLLLGISCKQRNKEDRFNVPNDNTKVNNQFDGIRLQLVEEIVSMSQDLMRASMTDQARMNAGTLLGQNPLADVVDKHNKAFTTLITMPDMQFQAVTRQFNNPALTEILSSIRVNANAVGNTAKAAQYMQDIRLDPADFRGILDTSVARVDLSPVGTDMRTVFAGKAELQELNRIMGDYPTKLDGINKKKMLVSWLAVPGSLEQDKRVLAALNGADPTLQKLMQLMGDRVDDPKLKTTLNALKQNIPSMEDYEIVRDLGDNKEWEGKKLVIVDGDFPPLNKVSGEIYVKKLAAASVGQTVLVFNPDTGQEEVYKILRPESAEVFDGGRKVLLDLTADMSESTRDLLSKSTSSVEVELDMQREVRNIGDLAPGYASSNPNFREISGNTVDSVSEPGQKSRKLIKMSKAEGKPISAWNSPEHVLVRDEAGKQWYKEWFKRAVLGDGKFHADPHAGNIFLDIQEGNRWTLTPIDYGSTSQLSLEQQKGVLLFTYGADKKDPGKVINSLEGLSSNLTEKMSDSPGFRTEISDEIDRILKSTDGKPKGEAILDMLRKKDVAIQQEFILFIRSQAFFENEFSNVKSLAGSSGIDEARLVKIDDLLKSKDVKKLIKSKMMLLSDKGLISSADIPELKKYENWKKVKKGLKIGAAAGAAAALIGIPLYIYTQKKDSSSDEDYNNK